MAKDATKSLKQRVMESVTAAQARAADRPAAAPEQAVEFGVEELKALEEYMAAVLASQAKEEREGQGLDKGQALESALKAVRVPAPHRLGRIKGRLVDSSVRIAADDPDEILYQHTVFCQTGLPYRNPGLQVRE